jgi:hypothetical protein
VSVRPEKHPLPWSGAAHLGGWQFGMHLLKSIINKPQTRLRLKQPLID